MDLAAPSPAPVSLRSCGPAEAQALALVGAATFLETFAGILEGEHILEHCARKHSAESYRSLLAEPLAAAWLAEVRSAPVGYALVTPPVELPVPLEQDDLELKRIYLLSRFQGIGIGLQLMECAREYARTHGAQRLLLAVYQGNPRAIAFYRRRGFAEVGTRTFHIGQGTYHDLILAANLR